jgi:hypothetical protein
MVFEVPKVTKSDRCLFIDIKKCRHFGISGAKNAGIFQMRHLSNARTPKMPWHLRCHPTLLARFLKSEFSSNYFFKISTVIFGNFLRTSFLSNRHKRTSILFILSQIREIFKPASLDV